MPSHDPLANSLTRSETHQSLFPFHPDPMFVIGPDSRLFDCNPKASELTGYRPEELAGRCWHDIIPAEDRSRAADAFAEAIAGRPVTFETHVFDKRGDIRALAFSLVPIVSNGQTIGLYGIARDMTERILTQDMLLRSRTEVTRLQDAFHLMAENMSDLLSITDRNGSIEYVSPSYERTLGFTLEESVGMHPYDRMHPEDREAVAAHYRREGTARQEMRKELRIRAKNGEYVMLEVHAVPILSAEGAVQNYLVVSRDIRDRKKTEELLLKTEKLSIAGQLAAGIAHEIRNPLTAIKGFLQLMRRKGTFEERYVSIISSEMERIETILTELLLLAKPQAVEMEKQQLTDILGDVVTLSDTQAILKNIRIVTDIEPSLPPIECVVSQIKQIFINFLKNAIDASQEGGYIVIEARLRSAHTVQIRVIDHGIGIPDDLIPKLGEPFYTTKEKGTGLGLMVSQKIVEQHHGTLRYASRLGKGTTVTVALPVNQPR